MTTVYECRNCKKKQSFYFDRCPNCHVWGTPIKKLKAAIAAISAPETLPDEPPRSSVDIELIERDKIPTGIDEFDRVFDGGLAPSSVIAFSGDPGKGKSTLTAQICHSICSIGQKALYLSGEEPESRIKRRLTRLRVNHPNLYIKSTPLLSKIVEYTKEIKPQLLVIDSIATVIVEGPDAPRPNTRRSITESLTEINHLVREIPGLVVIVIAHVTKDGSVAGPKEFQHMVDAVILLESGMRESVRVLTASKNRDAATSEVGFFEMTGRGMISQVPTLWHDEDSADLPGNVVMFAQSGERFFPYEVQALVTPGESTNIARNSINLSDGKLSLMLALLANAGVDLSRYSVMVEVSSEGPIKDRIGDLALLTAILSSRYEVPLGVCVAVGEVKIVGQVKRSSLPDSLIRELHRYSWDHILVPAIGKEHRTKKTTTFKSVQELVKWVQSQSEFWPHDDG